MHKIYLICLFLVFFAGCKFVSVSDPQPSELNVSSQIEQTIDAPDCKLSKEDAQNLLLEKLEEVLDVKSYHVYYSGINEINGINMHYFTVRENTNASVAALIGQYYVDFSTAVIYEYKVNHDAYNEMIEI